MVTSMLEKAIEIEGLLRIIRDGNPLPETYILLNIKSAELAEQALRLEERATASAEAADSDAYRPTLSAMDVTDPHIPSQETIPVKETLPVEIKVTNDISYSESPLQQPEEKVESVATDSGIDEISQPEAVAAMADFVMTTQSSSPTLPPVVFTEDDPALKHRSKNTEPDEATSGSQGADIEGYADLEDDDLVLQEEDDILLSFEDVPFSATDTFETPATVAGPEAAVFEEPSSSAETEDIATAASDPTATEPEPTEPNKTPQRQIKLKSAFSLNDRFLYARELFDGNMKMFDSTLEFIEGIEDYSIIEDYFYSELEWNPEDRNVAAFMEILRPHFKE